MTNWPKVSAVCNPNGDWSVVEDGGKVIADLSKGSGQHARLVEALKSLANEASGLLGIAGKELAGLVGNTNRACLQHRVDEARSVLAADSGHGCSETDSETQARNAKRIAAGLRLLQAMRNVGPEDARLPREVWDALAEAEDAG